jgi:hypothetical protein
MRLISPALFAAATTALAAPTALAQPAEPVNIQLNVLDNLQDRCRVTFVVENKQPAAIESLKLDLAVFNPEGAVRHRLIAELGPVRAAKTVVKAFAVDGGCNQVGAILVNEVNACAPASADACLETLQLSSRVKDVRLYK